MSRPAGDNADRDALPGQGSDPLLPQRDEPRCDIPGAVAQPGTLPAGVGTGCLTLVADGEYGLVTLGRL